MADTVLRLSGMRSARSFEIEPDAEARTAVAARLGIPAIRKLRFAGQISPLGAADWELEATLGATVQQECVVTLAPVTTRIDAGVTRRYLAEMPPLPEGDEIEMPEDDSAEPLPATLDLAEVMIEALALELPEWPRAEGVEAGATAVTEPGKTPLSDDDVRPFAALKGLRAKLAGNEDSEG